jgi:hypothetical protein
MIIRHDHITLHSKAKEDEFEKFMREELVPHFSDHYKGPTRVSKADLKRQSLVKQNKGHKYLWITEWDGSPESVRGSTFENTRMIKIAGTEAMLKNLESFGERAAEKVFSELVAVEVPGKT